MRTLTMVGTRPEIIRLSRLIPLLDEISDQIVVNTRQNFDPTLNENFFAELGLREPDVFFQNDQTDFDTFVGRGLVALGQTLDNVKPDAFLVLGDTNSAILSIAAKKRNIPVYHMEAGHRAHDPNVPEDVNRVLVDHMSDFNLVYSDQARRNLLGEGLEDRRICITGSPLPEVISAYSERVLQSDVLGALDLKAGQYIVMSLHRQENVNRRVSLERVLATAQTLAKVYEMPVVLSLHPRTRSKMESFGLSLDERILACSAFGFFDYLRLQRDAYCVVSDSGTLGEESAILDFPAVSIRASTERPEALESGMFVLSAPNPDTIVSKVRFAAGAVRGAAPDVYIQKGFSHRVANYVLSTYDIHRYWSGLQQP